MSFALGDIVYYSSESTLDFERFGVVVRLEDRELWAIWGNTTEEAIVRHTRYVELGQPPVYPRLQNTARLDIVQVIGHLKGHNYVQTEDKNEHCQCEWKRHPYYCKCDKVSQGA